jgi:hypothetical protein
MYLFPLTHIGLGMQGYFVSADGKFYSTKQIPQGRLMTGSCGRRGDARYYTLGGMTVPGAPLYRRAQAHGSWKAETTKPTIETTKPTIETKVVPMTDVRGKRSHALSVEAGIRARGWVIAQVALHDGVQHLLFGSKPAIHTTEASYKDEMIRLATSKPGTKYVALRIEKALVAGGLVWE